MGLYPPFTLLVRLLTESRYEAASEQAAAGLEKQVRREINAHPGWEQKVLLLNRDLPPVRMLRGKYRRQVLMKLLVSQEADELIAALTALAREPAENTEIWLEVNPTSMI